MTRDVDRVIRRPDTQWSLTTAMRGTTLTLAGDVSRTSSSREPLDFAAAAAAAAVCADDKDDQFSPDELLLNPIPVQVLFDVITLHRGAVQAG